MSLCKYCGKEIHWHRVNEKPKAFEDKDGTVFHHCNHLPDKNGDHKLLTSTITRVSKFEALLKDILERLKKLEEISNK